MKAIARTFMVFAALGALAINAPARGMKGQTGIGCMAGSPGPGWRCAEWAKGPQGMGGQGMSGMSGSKTSKDQK